MKVHCQLNDMAECDTEHVFLIVSIKVLQFELLDLMLAFSNYDQFKSLVDGKNLRNEKHLKGIVQAFLNSLCINVFDRVNTWQIFFGLLHLSLKLFAKGMELYCVFIVLSLTSYAKNLLDVSQIVLELLNCVSFLIY